MALGLLGLAPSWGQAMGRSPGSPIGPVTAPPSSTGYDLVTQPDPMDSSARLVMSGNAAGGMRFQGLVPYGSETDLRASLGSTYLDSFLRSSQGAVDQRFGLGGTIPFYSPSGSVARVVSSPEGSILAISGWATPVWAMDSLGAVSDGPILESMRPDASANVPLLSARSGPDSQMPGQPNAADSAWTRLYVGRSLDDIQATASQGRSVESPGSANAQDANEPAGGPGLPDVGGLGPAAQATPFEDPCGSAVQRMTRQEAYRTARPWRSSLDVLTQDRYEQCMETASARLKEGKAREASDAFGLALVYKPGDTAALAGRSHALFMAGEYASSALFLVRALDACPDYVRIPVDLAGLTGGQAVVQTKIEEAGAYLRQQSSPELRLILAYACFRTGDFGSARRTLDAGSAVDGPVGRALHVLGRALDEAQNSTGR
jgi:hypothetical protein